MVVERAPKEYLEVVEVLLVSVLCSGFSGGVSGENALLGSRKGKAGTATHHCQHHK